VSPAPDSGIADIAHCAEVAAHLAHYPPQSQAEVAARLGFTWRDWEAASAHWTRARDAELAAGGTHLSSRFVHAFVTTAERLQAQQAPLASIGVLPPGFALEAPPVAEPAPTPDGVTREPPAVEVTRVPTEAEEMRAPSFWPPRGALPVSPAARLLAATGAVSSAPAVGLPFVVGAAAALPAAVLESPAPSAGATVALSDLAAPPPLPPGVPSLTVEQYTSLRVELHLSPDRAALVMARYGCTPEGTEALFAHWRARFEADPPLRMWFARGYAQYLAWLRENAGAQGSSQPG
jgi:hypothetical protein